MDLRNRIKNKAGLRTTLRERHDMTRNPIDTADDIEIGNVRKYHDPALGDLRKAEYERSLRATDDVYRDPALYYDSVATEINLRKRSIKTQIVEIGGLLVEVKRRKHESGTNDFGDWVEQTCGISKSSALNYMRVYKLCAGVPQLVDKFNASTLYRIASPNFPELLRKEIITHAEDTDFENDKELHTVVTKLANGKIDISNIDDQEELRQLIGKQCGNREEKRYREELTALRRDINKRLLTVKELNDMGRMVPGLTETENAVSEKYIEVQSMLERFVSAIDHTLNNLHHDS